MEIDDRRLLNESVTTDAEVVVRVDLANFRPVPGRITLNLTANGTLVDQRTVTVGVDSRRTVYLRTTFDRPGRYEIRLDGVSVGTVAVSTATGGSRTATGDTTATVDRTTGSPSDTVAPTPASTSTGGETSVDRGTGTASPTRTGTTTPAVGPDEPTGTDAIIAAGMSLMLLYGVGVAVYVLREHPPGGPR